MQQTLIKTDDSDCLTIFFSGWGAAADTLDVTGNTLICYDYRTLSFDTTLLSGFSRYRLAAWSLGVWAAEHTPELRELPLESCAAIGGTPFPIDAKRGIAPPIFEGTLNGLNERTLMKFRRRMCGKYYELFMQHAPQRSVEELRDELAALADDIRSSESHSPVSILNSPFPWSRAYAGSDDLIFLAANQLTAWRERGVECRLVDAPHYFPSMQDLWINS